MILPTKRLGQDRALLTVGGEILGLLDEARPCPGCGKNSSGSATPPDTAPVTFDWFVLALDFLHALRAVEWERGDCERERHDSSNL